MRISAPGFLLLWMSMAAVAALAAPPAPESTPAVAPPAAVSAALSMVELSQELDRIAGAVATVEDSLAASEDLAAVQRALDAIESQLASRLAEAAPARLALLSPIGQDSLAEALKRLAGAVVAARAPLDVRAAELERGREIVRTGNDFIRQVRSGPQATDVPEALRARISSLDDRLERLRVSTVRALDAVVIQSDRASDMQQRISAALAVMGAAYRADTAATLAPDQPPLWRSLPERGLARIDFRESLAETWNSAADMVRTYPERSLVALLLLGLVIVGLLMLRRVALRAGGEAAADQLFVRCPMAAAVLIWAVLVADVVDLRLPAGVGMLRIVLVVGAAWPLLPLMVPAGVRLPLRGLLLLSVAGTWLTLLLGGHAAGSLGFLLIGTASWLLLRRLATAYAAFAATARPPRLLGVSRLALAAAQLLVAAGLVAIIIGYVRLGRQLVEGVLLSALLPVVLAVLSQVLGEIWDQLLERPALRRLRAVRDFPGEVSRRGHQLVNVALLFLALPVVVRIFPFSAPLWAELQELAGAKLEVGGISLSLLDLLAFGIGVTLAILIARFTRFVLDEDVLTRLPLASGARAAASRLIYYLLLTVGMLMALAAGGFQLSQLTLVVSALGLGIGFGLQNIVNNFVSGIVLAFERPFQAGDLIAVGQSTGRVSDIGLRATTVRTADGADVIVPNSTFISGEVTNWTLSDRMRRIQIAVGVAYGSDPRQVQALLLEVCARTPDVATAPAPVVALTGFGDSALNFQVLAWTPDADRLLVTTSVLAMGIYDSLNAAGISIPFPQREVRLLPTAPPAAAGS